jgi:predicted nucleic acid-binding protein
MTTAIDANVIISLWDKDPIVSSPSRQALEGAFLRGGLVIAAPVFAELLAAPGRTEPFLKKFLRETKIMVDWALSEEVWLTAARAFQTYAERRRKQRDSGTRRILADFVIGAHAQVNGFRFLTHEERLYRAAFPQLKIENVTSRSNT